MSAVKRCASGTFCFSIQFSLLYSQLKYNDHAVNKPFYWCHFPHNSNQLCQELCRPALVRQSHITAHPQSKAARPPAEQGLSQQSCRLMKRTSVEVVASECLQWDWRDLKLALSETEDRKYHVSNVSNPPRAHIAGIWAGVRTRVAFYRLKKRHAVL